MRLEKPDVPFFLLFSNKIAVHSTIPSRCSLPSTLNSRRLQQSIYYGNLVTNQTDLAEITACVGVFGSVDQSIPVDPVNQFEAALDSNGVINEIYIYGVGHAFANPSGDNYAPKETADAWEKTLAFMSKYV